MKYIKQSFLFIVLSFLLAAGVSIASSWVGPTAEPPNNNASAPINVSSASQIKLGALSVGGFALVDSTKGLGKILTSDANGNARWATPSGGGSSFSLGEPYTKTCENPGNGVAVYLGKHHFCYITRFSIADGGGDTPLTEEVYTTSGPDISGKRDWSITDLPHIA